MTMKLKIQFCSLCVGILLLLGLAVKADLFFGTAAPAGTPTQLITVTNGETLVLESVPATVTVERTFVVFDITGDGTIRPEVAEGTGEDNAGNLVSAFTGPALVVDNTVPTASVTLSEPVTANGPVIYRVTYSGVSAVMLSPGDITLIATGTAGGTVSVGE